VPVEVGGGVAGVDGDDPDAVEGAGVLAVIMLSAAFDDV
jgi:hypothetical protein